MRLFSAIELPEEARSHLVRLLDYWRGHFEDDLVVRLGIEPVRVSWVRNENLHVTLKFLGEMPDGDLAEVCRALSRIDLPEPMQLRVSAVACLPSRGSIHLISAGLVGDVHAVEVVHRAIEEECAVLGIPKERRKFLPHVTLARLRSPLPDIVRDLLHDGSAQYMPGPSFEVRGFALMASHLKPSGPEYVAIARFPSS